MSDIVLDEMNQAGKSAASSVPAPVEVEPGIFLDDMSTNKPQRSPEEIQTLLKYESASQTQRRIANDVARYAHQKSGTAANPQARLRDPASPVSSVHTWSH
jgi:hypothetical protein